MDSQQTTFKTYLPSAITLILIGWSGLAATLYFLLPFVWSRWAFFVFIIMALTGIALPIVFYFHKRFPEETPAEPNVIIRQSLWVGIYGATLAWLQLGHLVTLYVILGLAGGLIAAEYFIRIREKANRRIPAYTDDDSS
ncbi:MAG: hypothetical protein AABZ00_18650 [Chloroflexota bacterium]